MAESKTAKQAYADAVLRGIAWSIVQDREDIRRRYLAEAAVIPRNPGNHRVDQPIPARIPTNLENTLPP